MAVSRRTLLRGGAAVGGVAVVGVGGWLLAPQSLRNKLLPVYVPDVPAGRVRIETVYSEARGRDVRLFTAVPEGYGDGAGLPVIVVLHGASGRPDDYDGEDFGFGQFVTQAVRDGAPPFVLAGADGGALRWQPSGGDDPREMLVEELPQWLADRGFDADRRAVWGWSMGGFGALRLAETHPSWAVATAAFSPAIRSGDDVFANAAGITAPIGLWCGTEDSYIADVQEFADLLDPPPAIADWSSGAHTRSYWNGQLLECLSFLAGHL